VPHGAGGAGPSSSHRGSPPLAGPAQPGSAHPAIRFGAAQPGARQSPGRGPAVPPIGSVWPPRMTNPLPDRRGPPLAVSSRPDLRGRAGA
jgi:hypothetical protein